MSQEEIASAEADARPYQLDTQGWTEKTVYIRYIGPANPFPGSEVGSAGVYYDDIYDEEGTVVGHTVGYAEAIEKRESDGHIIMTYYESIELPEGMLKATGTIDQTTIFAGEWIHLDLKGTSGKFLGMSGSRDWQAIPPFQERLARVNMSCK